MLPRLKIWRKFIYISWLVPNVSKQYIWQFILIILPFCVTHTGYKSIYNNASEKRIFRREEISTYNILCLSVSQVAHFKYAYKSIYISNIIWSEAFLLQSLSIGRLVSWSVARSVIISLKGGEVSLIWSVQLSNFLFIY